MKIIIAYLSYNRNELKGNKYGVFIFYLNDFIAYICAI